MSLPVIIGIIFLAIGLGLKKEAESRNSEKLKNYSYVCFAITVVMIILDFSSILG